MTAGLNLTEAASAVSPFAASYRDFVDAGHPVLAIEPGTKRPGSYIKGRWHPAAGWQHFAQNPADQAMLERWARALGAGIGIPLGSRVGEQIEIAVDVDTTDEGELAAILAVLPPSPMIKIGAKGETRFYLADPAMASGSYKIGGRVILDMLATGRQTVCPPSLHPSGIAYRWSDGCGVVPASDLPMFTPNDRERLEGVLRALGWSPATDVTEQRVEAVQSAPRPGSGDTSDVWRETNDVAFQNLDAWCRHLGLPKLKRMSNGRWEAVPIWRASNSGTETMRRKSSLKIHSTGARDMGSDGPMTAVDIVMHALQKTDSEALTWLRDKLGLPEDHDDGGVVIDFDAIRENHLRKRAEAEARDVAKAASRFESGITWDDKEANASTAISWLVKGLLPNRGASMLYGQSASGKSFVSNELAACVVSGDPFFGHRVKATGGVLFALGEGAGAMPDRLNALRVGRFGGHAPTNPATGEPFDLDRLPIVWTSVGDLAKPTAWKAFADQVRATAREMQARHGCKLRLVIVDTVVGAFGFPEDPDASGGTAAMSAMASLGEELDLLFLPIHHAGKSKEAGAHGSYAWFASAETVLSVDAERHALTGHVGERRIFLKKNRHGGNEGWNQPFELRSVQLGFDEDGDPIESAYVAYRPPGANDNEPGADRLMTPGARRFLEALEPVFEHASADVELDDGSIVRAARVRDVKAEYLSRHGNSSSSERGFRRDLEAAEGGNLVGTSGSHAEKVVWPLDAVD